MCALFCQELGAVLFAEDALHGRRHEGGHIEHVGDMVDFSAGRLHLDPPYAESRLDRVLQENGPDNLHARDEVAGLDLRAVMDAVLVEPPPSGDIEEVEHEAEPPVCDYRDGEGEEVVREPVEDRGTRDVVEWRVGREVV